MLQRQHKLCAFESNLLAVYCGCRYPVILSFENHCSVEQQKIVALYLTDILGGILVFLFVADTLLNNFITVVTRSRNDSCSKE